MKGGLVAGCALHPGVQRLHQRNLRQAITGSKKESSHLCLLRRIPKLARANNTTVRHQLHSQGVGQDRLGQEDLVVADVGDRLENISVMIRSS